LALGYVAVVVASRFLFGERITWGKSMGCALIVLGVVVLALTA
jgi:multidrug transporter EmrE-like cation transporter